MNQRVLVVDDEARVRDALSLLLEEGGYEVVAAASGEAALAVLNREIVSLVLCDVAMPGMDGITLEENLHRAHASSATFTSATLAGANLSYAVLNETLFIGADLSGANLEEAFLVLANLRAANLRGANLYHANLNQANLRDADLKGATMPDGKAHA